VKRDTQKAYEGMERRGVNAPQSHLAPLELSRVRVGSYATSRRVEPGTT